MIKIIESLLGSFGIMVVGWATIPFAGYVAGVQITATQGFKMGLIFFVTRFLWLYALRFWFSKRWPR
jgi:hypothetical protein